MKKFEETDLFKVISLLHDTNIEYEKNNRYNHHNENLEGYYVIIYHQNIIFHFDENKKLLRIENDK